MPNQTFKNRSDLINAELIMDIFSECLDNGITEISTSEIMSMMGCSEKDIIHVLGPRKVDNPNNIVYDLSKITRKDVALWTDAALELFKPNK